MAEVTDDNDFAIGDLLATAGEEALGFDNPTIDGVEIEAHRSNVELDEIIVAGGLADAGGFTLTVRKSDFEALPEASQAEGAEVVSRDEEWDLLRVSKSVSHCVLTVGQAAASE